MTFPQRVFHSLMAAFLSHKQIDNSANEFLPKKQQNATGRLAGHLQVAPKIRALCGCNSHARLVGCGWHISSATPQPFHRTVKSKDKWICFQHLKSPRNRMLPCFHAKINTQKTIKTHIRHKNTTRKPIILGTDLQALKIAEANQNISPTSKIPPSRHLRPGLFVFVVQFRTITITVSVSGHEP